MQKISIAIPVYNSSKYLDHLIKRFTRLKTVGEIIIYDDFSNKEDYENTKRLVDKYSKTNLPLYLYQNTENLGAFKTKYNAIKKCRYDIVYQIDSDNLPMLGFDKFVKNYILNNFNSENIYYPSKIFQFYNFPYLSLFTSIFNQKYRVFIQNEDFIANKNIIKKSLIYNQKITFEKNIRWLTNIGNFFVNRKMFLNAMTEGLSLEKSKLNVDAVAITYYWIKNYNGVEQKKHHYHFHRKRTDSISVITKNVSNDNFLMFEEKIKLL